MLSLTKRVDSVPSTVSQQLRSARVPLTMTIIGGSVLFILASLRHYFLRSGGYDLGIFDQALYLISQGKAPISSLIGMHMMADHVSFVLYPLGWLYKIFPSVHTLFAVQTFSLASGCMPLYFLAKQASLSRNQSIGLSIAYLLYPVTIFASLFDFNPQTITVPFLLGSVYFARARKLGWFTACITTIMLCRDASSLTIVFLGLWLFGFEKRRLAGLIAIISGLAWFIITTKLIAPMFLEQGSVSTLDSIIIRNYGYLGSSFGEIFTNLLFRPEKWVGQLAERSTLRYLAVLLVPLAWALYYWRAWAPLIVTIPTFAMNILAQQEQFRSLKYYYDLPILPFIFLVVIGAMVANKSLIKRGRTIVIWTMALIVISTGIRLTTSNVRKANFATFQASHEAISMVQPSGTLLTNHSLAPHLSQRPTIHVYPVGEAYEPVFAQVDSLKHLVKHPLDISIYQQILLRTAQQDAREDQMVNEVVTRAKADSRFKLTYDNAGVFLFEQQKNG